MNINFMFIGILVQVLLRNLEVAANTRVLSLPLDLGFDPKNLNKSSVFSHKKEVVCMLDSWSHWRDEGGAFKIANIDPTLCTQLVYRNAGIDNTTFQIKIRDPQLAEGLGWYRKITSLTKANPHLKVLLSVGGWSEGSFTFSKLAADYKKRAIFVDSILRILQEYGWAGIDIAWEYPAWTSRGGTLQDKENLPLLIKELRNALEGEYIISLTVAGDTHFATPAYNLKALANMVDQFNIRAFDFAGAWNDKTYHHSPLKDSESRQSVANTVNFYLENGAPADKLILGIPFYGRTFLLKDNVTNSGNNETILVMSGLDQPTNGKFGGNWIPDNLLMGYHEICHEISTLNKNNWQTYWDNFCMTPFARHNKRWVTFDNPESIEAKVSFVLTNQLKGVMAWTIDTDDFTGSACKRIGYDNDDDESEKNMTYPLLRAVNFQLSNGAGEQRSRSESHGPENSNSKETRGTGDLQKQNGNNSVSGFAGLSFGLVVWSFLAVIVTVLTAE